MGLRDGLDRCGKSRVHRDSIPGPSSPGFKVLYVPEFFCVLVKAREHLSALVQYFILYHVKALNSLRCYIYFNHLSSSSPKMSQ